MNSTVGIISIVIILVNVLFSYQGFSRLDLFNRYMFWVDGIRTYRQYDRLVTSGFLHTGWFHLIVNMYVLYEFSRFFEYVGSPFYFILLYVGSLVGGNLLALWIRQHNPGYRAVGASGAVSGLLFAYAAFAPWQTIYLFFFIPMWPWVFALIYVAFSIYGIRSQRDNIGHEAHLGGAIVGLLITLAFRPQLMQMYPWVIAGILVPTAAFLYIVATRPHLLYVPGAFKRQAEAVTRKMKVVKSEKKFSTREEEINYLLDKGYENLSRKERERLRELSEK